MRNAIRENQREVAATISALNEPLREKDARKAAAADPFQTNHCAKQERRNVAVHSLSKEVPLKARAQAVTTTAQRPESWEEHVSAGQQRF